MILLLNLIVISALLFLGHIWSGRSELKRYYWPAVILKIAAGIVLGLVYTYYYQGGDTYSFFEAAVAISDIGFASWQNFTDIFFRNNYEAIPGFFYTWIPSAVFVKILSFLALFTGGNYWLSGVYLSIFSFSGLWIWTLSLWRLTQNKLIAIVSGLFVPSILFWSSGVMKESLAIPALAILAALFVIRYMGIKLSRLKIITGIIMFIVLALTKYFIAAAFLATVVSIVITRKVIKASGKWHNELLVLILSFMLIGGLVSITHPNLWLSRIAEVIFNNYQAYQYVDSHPTTMKFNEFQPNILSILVNMPRATVIGIFWPLVPIKGSILSIAAVFENWLIVLGVFAMFINLKISSSRRHRLLFWGGILFVIVSSGLIALSTPNLGTLARYKTGYLLILAPYLVSGIIMSYRKFLTKG